MTTPLRPHQGGYLEKTVENPSGGKAGNLYTLIESICQSNVIKLL